MEQYFKELEHELMDIPEEDRVEAILYYKDYVFDASVTVDTIEEVLGTPKELARNIRKELFGTQQEEGVRRKTPIPYKPVEQYTDTKKQEKSKKKRKRTTLETVLIILLLIVTFPFWIGIVGAIGCILFAVLTVITVVPLSLLFAAVVVGICFIGTGIILFIVAISKLFVVPLLALVPFGIACLMFGLGVLLVLLTGTIVFKVLPWLIRGILKACSKCFYAIKGIF